MHPELTGNMRKDLMSVLQFYLEHGIRQRFNDRSFNLDDVLFGHPSFSFLFSIEPSFDLIDSVPKLRVGYASSVANAAGNLLASDPDPFEMQHVFAFGPVEAAFIAVGHERESLLDKSDHDR